MKIAQPSTAREIAGDSQPHSPQPTRPHRNDPETRMVMEGRVDHASIEVQSIILTAIGGFRAHRVLTRREASSSVLSGTIEDRDTPR